MGIKDIETREEDQGTVGGKEIALLGFHRTASSLLHEILSIDTEESGMRLKDKLIVVDFNPEMHRSLQNMGVKVVYGDISHPDTLHHVGIHDVKVVISTIPDTLLVGTDNLKIIRHIREICPHAKIIVTAESTERAMKMYTEGADYVFMPRILAAQNLIAMIQLLVNDKYEEFSSIVLGEKDALAIRNEIIR